MRLVLSIIFTVLWLCPVAFAQESIDAFGHKIAYSMPDSSIWHIVQNSNPNNGNKGVLMFKREPILDSQKRSIEPIMAIVYESVPDSIEAIEYSAALIGNKPFRIKHELLGGYPDYSSDMHSAVFRGEYLRDSEKHIVLIGYILSEHVGVEIIADATDEVFSKTEADMAAFIKSVVVK